MVSRMYMKASGQGKDDETYLCYETASDSFVGALSDEFSMEEEDVKDYIKYSNPGLYERLHRLPFASSDVPQSFQAQRQFRRTFEVEHSTNARPSSGTTSLLPCNSAHGIAGQIATPQATYNLSSHTFDTMKMELRNNVRTKLISGHVLILKKHPPLCHPLNCESPTCRFQGLVYPGSFYLTLRLSYFTHDDVGCVGDVAFTHYCLCCLEDIFDGQYNVLKDEDTQHTNTALDGVGRELILRTAKRLYIIHDRASIEDQDSVSKATPIDKASSEVDTNLETRGQKQAEIEATLAEVVKFEKCRKTSEGSDSSSSSDLSISRPYFMERPKDRYKKQGLTRYDKIRMRLEEKKRQSVSPQVSPTSTSSHTSEDRQCYCREPGVSTSDMIQCNNKWCPIGWIHLRCAGLDESSVQAEDFLCDYCKNDCGPFEHTSEGKKLDERTDSSSAMSLDSMMDGNGNTTCDEDQMKDSEQEDFDRGDEDDEEEEDYQEDEEDVTITARSSGWGVPINLQPKSTTYYSDERMWQSPSHSKGATANSMPFPQPEQFHATEPVSLTNDSNTNDLFHRVQPTTSETEEHSNPSRIAGFADLASFMFAVDLSADESRVFEQWKISVIQQSSPIPVLSTTHADTCPYNDRNTNGACTHTRLSQLLLQAQDQALDDSPVFL